MEFYMLRRADTGHILEVYDTIIEAVEDARRLIPSRMGELEIWVENDELEYLMFQIYTYAGQTKVTRADY